MKNRLVVICLAILLTASILSACAPTAPISAPTPPDIPVPALTTALPAIPDNETTTPALAQSYSVNETLSLDLVLVHDEVVVAGDGKPIVLINNTQASNPSYNELAMFLENDMTDVDPYDNLIAPYSTIFITEPIWSMVAIDYYTTWSTFGSDQTANTFPIRTPPRVDRIWHLVCTDFAEIVHNNAELQGIRSAFVAIAFVDEPSHALNAFETTDKGLVFIDSTGKDYVSSSPDFGSFNDFLSRMDWDKVAYVQVGEKLTFSPVRGDREWEPLGIVKEVTIQW